MNLFRSKRFRLTSIIVLTASLILPSCVSRYRLDLYQSIEQSRRKTKIQESLFVEGVVLGDLMADAKLDLGSGNCIVLTTDARGEQLDTDVTESLFLGFFESLRCKLYLELPAKVVPGTISLPDHSLVQLLGKYELPPEEKIFKPVEGTFVIDSIVEMKTLFGEVKGQFANHRGQQIGYDGRFKVKVGK